MLNFLSESLESRMAFEAIGEKEKARELGELTRFNSRTLAFIRGPSLPFFLRALVVIFFLFSAPLLPAQTAAEMERLLDTKEITYGEAAYFTLASVMENPPESPPGAFALALEKGWFPDNADPDSFIKLRNLSLLVMKSFGLEGGLMYRLFPGPRYAFREMTRQGFIEGRAYPLFTVSGERFLHILGNVLSHTGDGL